MIIYMNRFPEVSWLDAAIQMIGRSPYMVRMADRAEIATETKIELVTEALKAGAPYIVIHN